MAIKILTAGHTGAAAVCAAEARLLARLDHPHIVRVHDYVEAGDLHLIVMELLDGGTLARLRAGMAPETACAVGLAVAEALSHAHALTPKVLHRDIKPGNVLFDTSGLPKVADFGLARIVEGAAATASRVIGTPAYMAPEQIDGGRLGPATDLYSLGVVLYELLAGALPFDPTLPTHALWQHHLHTVPAPPAGVPAPVAEVVLRALAKDPGARQPSVRAFALDLAAAAARAYGPNWVDRSSLRHLLHLHDDVRKAASQSAGNALPDPPTRPADDQPAFLPRAEISFREPAVLLRAPARRRSGLLPGCGSQEWLHLPGPVPRLTSISTRRGAT